LQSSACLQASWTSGLFSKLHQQRTKTVLAAATVHTHTQHTHTHTQPFVTDVIQYIEQQLTHQDPEVLVCNRNCRKSSNTSIRQWNYGEVELENKMKIDVSLRVEVKQDAQHAENKVVDKVFAELGCCFFLSFYCNPSNKL